MSPLGQKLAHARAVAMSASRHQADFPNSLLGAIFFPVCGKKFPVSIAGNSSKEAPSLKGFAQAGRDVSRETPCIFPRIREFGCRDSFAAASQYSHLVARFSALFRNSSKLPEEARNCATNWRLFFYIRREREGPSAKTPRFFCFISTGHFRGHTSRSGRWSAPSALHPSQGGFHSDARVRGAGPSASSKAARLLYCRWR